MLPGSYNIALGRRQDDRPNRSAYGDPEVALTTRSANALRHGPGDARAQKRTTEAATGLAALNRRSRGSPPTWPQTDIPADVRHESLKTDAAAMTPKLPVAAAGGGRGGGGGGSGRGGGDTSVVGKIGQAKNGMSGGMWPLDDDEGLRRREDGCTEGASDADSYSPGRPL